MAVLAPLEQRRPNAIQCPFGFKKIVQFMSGIDEAGFLEMTTQTDQIADGIYRISTFVPEIAAPAGFVFNQYLIDAEQPFLFHCGPRAMFPAVSGAVAGIMPLARL